MKFTARAASLAAMTICAATFATATTPGFAQALQDVPLQLLNPPVPPVVPTVDATDPTLLAIQAEERQADPVEAAETAPAVAVAEGSGKIDFDTLHEAVAAQDLPSAPDSELNCLAIGVYYEAKGEPLAGQLAVAHVILNRTQSGRFPKSVCSVLTQRGQFSFVRGGRLPTPPNGLHWRKALAVAQVAQKDLWDSPVPKALFFHARYVSPRWRRARVGTIGNHIFYR